jgi:hypothetical protein
VIARITPFMLQEMLHGYDAGKMGAPEQTLAKILVHNYFEEMNSRSKVLLREGRYQ